MNWIFDGLNDAVIKKNIARTFFSCFLQDRAQKAWTNSKAKIWSQGQTHPTDGQMLIGPLFFFLNVSHQLTHHNVSFHLTVATKYVGTVSLIAEDFIFLCKWIDWYLVMATDHNVYSKNRWFAKS